jgi:hypothetical protein
MVLAVGPARRSLGAGGQQQNTGRAIVQGPGSASQLCTPTSPFPLIVIPGDGIFACVNGVSYRIGYDPANPQPAQAALASPPNIGTTIAPSNFGTITGAGTGATVTNVVGTDSYFSFQLNDGTSPNATQQSVVLSFHSGTWSSVPVCIGTMLSVNSSVLGVTGAQPTPANSLTQQIIYFNVVSGTPANGNSFLFQYICAGPNAALQISTTSLPAGTNGGAYSATVQALGGVQPYTWSATGLPGWASIASGTGVVSGTAATGSTTPCFTVTDSATPTANAVTQCLTLTVANGANPTITSVSPSSGTTAGGTVISVIGTNFIVATPGTISFGGTNGTSLSCASTTSCTVTTPAKSAGAVDVVVTNANGSATCTSCYSYVTASGSTYFTTDFESGLPAGIPGDTGSVSPGCLPVISTAQAHGGTHSALIQSDYQGACGSTSRFDWTGPQSYTFSDLHANGLYWSYWVYIDATSSANGLTSPARHIAPGSPQYKMDQFHDGPTGTTCPGTWVTLGFSTQTNTNQVQVWDGCNGLFGRFTNQFWNAAAWHHVEVNFLRNRTAFTGTVNVATSGGVQTVTQTGGNTFSTAAKCAVGSWTTCNGLGSALATQIIINGVNCAVVNVASTTSLTIAGTSGVTSSQPCTGLSDGSGYSYTVGQGTVTVWWDGAQIFKETETWYGNNNSGDTLFFTFPQYVTGAAGPVTVYLDDITIADGFVP